MRLFGRLRLQRSQAELSAISGRLIAAYPDDNRVLNLQATVGGGLGLPLAEWSLRALIGFCPVDIPRIDRP